MCFSATASFVTAAALTPIGFGALRLARRRPRSLLPLAALPLLFAAQQTLEGLVWLGLQGAAPPALVRPASLAYLAFAFALWPVWLPWCSLRLAAGHTTLWQRRLMQLLWAMGWLLAVSLAVPLLVNASQVAPLLRQGSIDYQVRLPWSELLGHQPVTALYALIICVPLLLTPYHRLRWFAAALAVAFVVAQLAFLHAFSSVWCYFSAVLSLLVLWILREPQGQAAPQRGGCADHPA